jgi:hypothetical protein
MALGLLACRPAEDLPVSWPSADYAVAALVEIRSPSGPALIQPPFHLDGEDQSQNPLRLSIDRRGDEVWLVGLEKTDLPVELDVGPVEELSYSFEPSSCELLLRSEHGRMTFSAGDVAEFHRLDTDASVFDSIPHDDLPTELRSMLLEGPTFPELCMQTKRLELTPFGDQERLVSTDLKEVIRLDATRVLARGTHDLYLFERGQLLADDDRHHLQAEFDADGDMTVGAMGMTGAGRVILAGTFGAGGKVVEAELGPEGLRLVRTASIVRAPVQNLLMDERERPILVGDDGLVLTAGSLDTELVDRSLTGLRGDNIRGIRSTGVAERPHVMFTEGGRIVLGDVFTGEGDIEDLGRGEITAITVGPDIRLVAALASGELLQRVGDGEWTDLPYLLPSESDACIRGNEPCANRKLLAWMRAMSSNVQHRFGVLSGCSALFVQPLDSRCMSVFPPRSTAIDFSDRPFFRAVHAREDFVTVVGSDGIVLEMELSSSR